MAELCMPIQAFELKQRGNIQTNFNGTRLWYSPVKIDEADEPYNKGTVIGIVGEYYKGEFCFKDVKTAISSNKLE